MNLRPGPRHSGGRVILGLAGLLVLLIAARQWLGAPRHRRRGPAPSSRATVPQRESRGTSGPAEGTPRPARPSSEGPTRVAIVIDDIGYDEPLALEFARLDAPLTFAVLPHLPHSASVAAQLHELGREVFLHLPMQPIGYPRRDPGEGAVIEGMSEQEVRDVVLDDLREVPWADGFNNHMGSRATSDPVLMHAVLEVALERDLLFLDSRTTSESIAFAMARSLGVRALSRAVFLDDRRERTYIEAQVQSLLDRARAEGSAVGIGHPDPETLQALRRSLSRQRSSDFEIVPASRLAGGGGRRAG